MSYSPKRSKQLQYIIVFNGLFQYL